MESSSCSGHARPCALCAGMAGGREEGRRCHLLSCWDMAPGGQGGQRVQCVQPISPRQHVLGGPRTLGTPASAAFGPGCLQKPYPAETSGPGLSGRIKAHPGSWLGKLRLREGNWVSCALAFPQGSGLGWAPSTDCRPGCERVISPLPAPRLRPWAWTDSVPVQGVPTSWSILVAGPRSQHGHLKEAEEGLFLPHVTTSSALCHVAQPVLPAALAGGQQLRVPLPSLIPAPALPPGPIPLS